MICFRSVRSLILSLCITRSIPHPHLMSTLSYEINETRNESQKHNRVHDIHSRPFEPVREVLLDTILLFNPDILMHSSFAKVATIDSAHSLSCVFYQNTSGIHLLVYGNFNRRTKSSYRGDIHILAVWDLSTHSLRTRISLFMKKGFGHGRKKVFAKERSDYYFAPVDKANREKIYNRLLVNTFLNNPSSMGSFRELIRRFGGYEDGDRGRGSCGDTGISEGNE